MELRLVCYMIHGEITTAVDNMYMLLFPPGNAHPGKRMRVDF